MKIEIDQSGKVEQTAQKTVIGDSLGNSVFLTAKDKRKIQEVYRLAARPNVFVYETFAILTALLIKKTFNNTNIYIVDLEYPGHEHLVQGLIKKFLNKMNVRLSIHQIRFEKVGKKSMAHKTANFSFKSTLKGERILVNDMLGILMQ